MELNIIKKEEFWNEIMDSDGESYIMMKPEFVKWMQVVEKKILNSDSVVSKDAELDTSS